MSAKHRTPGKDTEARGTRKGWLTTFDAFQVVSYRWFWLSLLSSMAAFNMHILIRGWLVYELTGSPRALGLVSASAGVALIAFAPIGGVVADRVDKRNLMIAAQSASALLAVVIFPAIGGLLASIVGIAGAYCVVVFCYIAAAVLLLRVPPTGVRAVATSASVSFHLAEGLSYIRRSPILVSLLLMAAVPILLGMPYQMLMPVFAESVLGVGVRGLGFLMAAVGVGALIGSLLVASLGDFRRKGLLLLGSVSLFGLGLIPFALSGNFYLSLGILFCVGVVNTAYLSTNNTLIQTNVDDQVRGRVMSIYVMTFGFNGVGVLLVGEIAEHLDAPLAVAMGGALVLLFGLVMLLRRPALRRL